MFNLHIYILHCKTLESRKNLCDILHHKIKESGKFASVSFSYIEKYDVPDIGKKEIEEYVNLEKSKIPTPFESLLQGIHVRKLSNALKHYEAIKEISNKPKKDFGLVLEDDVVYSDNVVDRLFSTIQELNENYEWDINFLGLPQPADTDSPSSIKISPVNSIFKILPDISSYIIRPKSAQKLVQQFIPVRFQTNIHFSYIMIEKAKDLISFTMSSPNVFVDGSKFGVYVSSIKPNNKLILNQDYTKLYKDIHDKDTFSSEEKKEIYSHFESVKFNIHPEFQNLLGIFEMKQGNYLKAKDIFEKCYEVYISNDCLLNGESEFLETYAQLFKHLQDDIKDL